MFSRQSANEVTAVARRLDIEPAALLAVATVESGGTAYALIDGRPEPLIRFEGHYFDRRLTGERQKLAREAGLAHPTPGAVANPASQAVRWAMLTRAAAIDRKAAYESTSWGIGQVMGAHWAWLGYPDIGALVEEARSSVTGQAMLMARYIRKAGLAEALRAHDWAGFASLYNGPGYARNRYDVKLRQAYLQHAQATRETPPVTATLRRGSKGEDVRRLQQRLSDLGYPLSVDGLFGPRTAAMVASFQRDCDLVADGIAGPRTWEALDGRGNALRFPSIVPDWIAALLRRLFSRSG